MNAVTPAVCRTHSGGPGEATRQRKRYPRQDTLSGLRGLEHQEKTKRDVAEEAGGLRLGTPRELPSPTLSIP